MKNFYVLAMLVAVLGLTACGKGDKGDMGPAGPQGPTGPVATPTPVSEEQALIDELIADENDYRLSLGQTILSNGLSCTVYTINPRYVNPTTGASTTTYGLSGYRTYLEYGQRIQSSVNLGQGGEILTLQGLTQVMTYLYKGSGSETFNQPVSPISDGMNVLPASVRSTLLDKYMLRCQGQVVIPENGNYTFTLASDDASLLYIDGSKVIDNDNNHGVTTVSGTRSLRKGVHTFRIDYAQAGGGSQALILTANGVSIPPQYFFH